jgi:arylsulfatase A-like enzyme
MPLLRRAGLALPLCLLACSPEPQTRVTVHDLAALLPVAEVRREVGAIDFGSAAGREHLASGWHRNEHGRDGRSFVWSRGAASVVELFLAAPRNLRAELRCAPIPTGDGRPQSMRVELNGRPLGTVALAPGMRDYVIALPRAAQVAGVNRLTFRYRAVSAPHPDNGRRQLALQVDLLRLRPARQPGAAPPRSAQGALVLPFGTEVVYDLDLPGAADLALPRIEGERSAGGRLMVEVREEGGSPEIRELAPRAATQSVELPGSGPRLVRVTLRAVAPSSPGDGGGAGSDGGEGGLTLKSPVVRAVRPPGERRAEPGPRPWSGRPNVILYLVDTLRADRLGCYGAAKPVSPAIDDFARGATLFERAVAQSSWTRPSVTSVLTGLGPLAHGVKTLDDRLADAAVTLPELLRAAGYRTAAFSTNPHVSAATGLAQGFDDFELVTDDPRSAAVNRRVLGWLAGRPEKAGKASPFFLYVHTIDPHAPYQPPFELLQRFAPGVLPDAGAVEEIRRAHLARGEERQRRVAQLSALYDAEVAANDRSFGELLAELRRRGLYDDALIVFVADHGEEFDEHGDLGHGQNLYGQTLDVPLIVKWPRQARGERVPHLAQQLDLLPTVVSAAGLRPPPGLPGGDLFTLGPGRHAFSHLSYEGRDGMSLTEGDWKLILPLSRKFGLGPELYRRGGERPDPGERVNRAASDDIRAGWLRAQIRLELLRSRAAGEARAPRARADIDEETRKALEALGYL